MKKLSEEQLLNIAHDTFIKLCPNYNQGDELNSAEMIISASLNAIVQFMLKYQNEINE